MIKTLLDRAARIFRAGSPNPKIMQEASEDERRLIDLLRSLCPEDAGCS